MEANLQGLSPITVVRAEEHDKAILITHLSQEPDQTKAVLTKAHILNSDNETYLIVQDHKTGPLGYVITADYTRLDQSKEIVFYSPGSIETIDLYIEILQQIIGVLSEDNLTNYIILKIRDSQKNLACAAESVGFMKDGIFISNQFLVGEFTFYSVYQYKLA